MVMREGIQDVERMTKHYNTVDGDFLRRHQCFTMKTHRTMLKNQAVFSYPWVARISCLRLSACVGAQAGLQQTRCLQDLGDKLNLLWTLYCTWLHDFMKYNFSKTLILLFFRGKCKQYLQTLTL